MNAASKSVSIARPRGNAEATAADAKAVPGKLEDRQPKEFSGAGERGPRVFLPAAVLVMSALAAYSNSLTGEFIFDDQSNIVENHMIRDLWPLWGPFAEQDARRHWHIHSRPVVVFSFALNYALAGLAPWPYHLTNLAIHVLAGLSLFGFIRHTLLMPSMRRFSSAATELAAAIAIAWAVHPINTQGVTYVVQRYESLMGLFYLFGMYCVARSMTATRTRSWTSAAIAACVLALASKEVAASLPMMALLYDRAFVAGSFAEAWRRRRWLHLGLFLAILAFAPFFKVYSGGEGRWAGQAIKIPWHRYAVSEAGVVLHYLRLVLWPANQCLDYGWPLAASPMEVAMPLMAVAALLLVTLWLTAVRPICGFPGIWFFLILAPTSSIMPIVDLAYEHRMYLSSAAVIATVVLGAWLALDEIEARQLSLGARTAIPLAVWLAAVGALGTATYLRNKVYANPITAWTDTVREAPHNSRAHSNLGVALLNVRSFEAAAVELREAIRLAPANVDAHANLGACQLQQRDLAGARASLEHAVEINPYSALAERNLATVLLEQGELAAAEVRFHTALLLAPNDSKLHFNFACLQMRKRNRPLAENHLRQTVKLAPHDAAGHFALANILADREQWAEAHEHWLATLSLVPSHVGAHVNLARALWRAGRQQDASFHVAEALRLDPANRQAIRLAVAISTPSGDRPRQKLATGPEIDGIIPPD